MNWGSGLLRAYLVLGGLWIAGFTHSMWQVQSTYTADHPIRLTIPLRTIVSIDTIRRLSANNQSDSSALGLTIKFEFDGATITTEEAIDRLSPDERASADAKISQQIAVAAAERNRAQTELLARQLSFILAPVILAIAGLVITWVLRGFRAA